MPKDKFSAVWVSYSSIEDYIKCPRAYYLKNVYRDPRTGHKVKLMQPALALGQAVHEVIDSLSILPAEKRLTQPLVGRLENTWIGISGKLGGFKSKSEEQNYKERGRQMLKRLKENPGPILNQAVKIPQELPYYWLSEDENIILCGKIDWLEYLPEDDSVHIIDFKTGKKEEHPDSLQLPIYYLLVSTCQKRPVNRASYWYLHRDDDPKTMTLPEKKESEEKILKIAKKIKLARTLNHFRCPQNGCNYCHSFEAILKGHAELVGVDHFNADIYVL